MNFGEIGTKAFQGVKEKASAVAGSKAAQTAKGKATGALKATAESRAGQAVKTKATGLAEKWDGSKPYTVLAQAPDKLQTGKDKATALASQLIDKVPADVLEKAGTAKGKAKELVTTGYGKLPEGAQTAISDTASKAQTAVKGAKPSNAYLDASTAAAKDARTAWDDAAQEAYAAFNHPPSYKAPKVKTRGIKGLLQRGASQFPHVKEAGKEIKVLEGKYRTPEENSRLAQLTEQYPWLRGERTEVTRTSAGHTVARRNYAAKGGEMDVAIPGADGKTKALALEHHTKHGILELQGAETLGPDELKALSAFRDENAPGTHIRLAGYHIGDPKVADLKDAGFRYGSNSGYHGEVEMRNAVVDKLLEADPDLKYKKLGDAVETYVKENQDALAQEYPEVFRPAESLGDAKADFGIRALGGGPVYGNVPKGR